MTLNTPSPLVQPDWLEAHLGEPALRIIDCSVAGKPDGRGGYVFEPQYEAWETAHIPGSIFVDIPKQLSDRSSEVGLMMPAPDVLMQTMQALGVGDDSCAVLYDSSNHAWAARVWWMLRVCGFDNAGVLNGGLNKWKSQDRPLACGPFSFPPAACLTASPRPELMASKQDVVAVLDSQDVVLLNSLPRPIFTGEVAPYGRAGHIPGSCNLSCESIIDPDTSDYLDLDTLRHMAEESGALAGKKVITYCGGGIAASSTALVLTMLGVQDVALYDGSLSEWCRDPDLPLATC